MEWKIGNTYVVEDYVNTISYTFRFPSKMYAYAYGIIYLGM